MPAVGPVNAEEWDYLDIDVPDTFPIYQGLIPQGEHLTKRCSQWEARQEVRQGWCPEVG